MTDILYKTNTRLQTGARFGSGGRNTPLRRICQLYELVGKFGFRI